MHPITKEIIEKTREQFQLDDFYLKSFDLLNHEDQQIVLSMDWLPNGAVRDEDESNPPGTVGISIDIDTKKIIDMVFVDGRNLLSNELFPQVDNLETVIEWVEDQTQLEYGRQFKLVKETEDNIVFHAAVDNIKLFPGGSIDVCFNEEGVLSSFFVHGSFANESQIHWEPFNLIDEAVFPLVKQHCKLIEVPDEATETWKPYYAVSSFLIKNHAPNDVIYFDEAENNLSYRTVNTTLTWQEPSAEQFKEKKIHLDPSFTEEEVFQNRAEQNNNIPIPDDMVNQIIAKVTNMMRMEFPNDSGLWRLTSLKREQGYLLAKVDPSTETPKILYPSLRLWINSATLEVDNYMDTKPLLEAFDFFKEPEAPKIDAETASTRLYEYIELQPVYVYDQQTEMYQLYGKVDGGIYGIDAITGELSTVHE